MSPSNSYISTLKSRIDDVVARMEELFLISELRTERVEPHPYASLGSGVKAQPKYRTRWMELTDDQKIMQGSILEDFQLWYREFTGLFSKSEVEIKISPYFPGIESLITYRSYSGTPTNQRQAIREFNDTLTPYYKILDEIIENQQGNIILVPDTSALLDEDNLEKYEEIIENENFQVILTTNLLSEIDDLKRSNKKISRKAQTIAREIKKLGDKGDLDTGIAISDTISVRTDPVEPDFEKTLPWLDKNVPNDRFIAKSLEIQRQNPGATIIVVASDINLINKARKAGLPTLDPPKKSDIKIE